MKRILREEMMRQFGLVIGLWLILAMGAALCAEKLSDFKEKAPNLNEKTQAALQSVAFKELRDGFKEKRVAVRFLEKGAYTAKFVNAKDKKEYLLTAVPMVSYFEEAAPPLAALILSDGSEFRAGWLEAGRDRAGKTTCSLQTSAGKAAARAKMIEMLKEPPLPVERGEAAIAIAKNPEGDEVILILCRSPYPAKKDGEIECMAAIFYSGDLSWDKFAPGKPEPEPDK